jgi:hypothetical protein
MYAGRLSFWVTVYFNRSGLVKALPDLGVCTREQFDSFWTGFSQSSTRFSVVDVGDCPGATTAKIRG